MDFFEHHYTPAMQLPKLCLEIELRQKAMECAASTNPSSANELLATADKVYEWMTQDVKEKTPQ
jgi:hypothetical protein